MLKPKQMLPARRKRFTYANVASTLALVFAMTGGAYAADKVLITSTKQISPKVLTALKGKNGKNGTNGAQGLPAPQAPPGQPEHQAPTAPTAPTAKKEKKAKKAKKAHPGPAAAH